MKPASSKYRKQPTCSRCRFHGQKDVRVLQHMCPFKSCTCSSCILIKKRSVIYRAQKNLNSSTGSGGSGSTDSSDGCGSQGSTTSSHGGIGGNNSCCVVDGPINNFVQPVVGGESSTSPSLLMSLESPTVGRESDLLRQQQYRQQHRRLHSNHSCNSISHDNNMQPGMNGNCDDGGTHFSLDSSRNVDSCSWMDSSTPYQVSMSKNGSVSSAPNATILPSFSSAYPHTSMQMDQSRDYQSPYHQTSSTSSSWMDTFSFYQPWMGSCNGSANGANGMSYSSTYPNPPSYRGNSVDCQADYQNDYQGQDYQNGPYQSSSCSWTDSSYPSYHHSHSMSNGYNGLPPANGTMFPSSSYLSSPPSTHNGMDQTAGDYKYQDSSSSSLNEASPSNQQQSEQQSSLSQSLTSDTQSQQQQYFTPGSDFQSQRSSPPLYESNGANGQI